MRQFTKANGMAESKPFDCIATQPGIGFRQHQCVGRLAGQT